MTQVGIALDDIADIADFSAETMLALASRLEHSTSFQALIAREIELDELWRRLETGLKVTTGNAAARARRQILETMFGLVWEAHDLAGEGQPGAAASKLRQASALAQNG